MLPITRKANAQNKKVPKDVRIYMPTINQMNVLLIFLIVGRKDAKL